MTNETTAAKMIMAAYLNNLKEVQRNVEAGVHPDDCTNENTPAIIAASMQGWARIVEYLIKKGANVNNYLPDKCSSLKSAARGGYTSIVKMLLEAGAEPNYERNGEIALTLACDDHTDIELLGMLLPISDKAYYQKAYQYATTMEMRDMIKKAAPKMTFVEPSDGFGGPEYRKRIHYQTPPNDPILAEIYELLDMYVKDEAFDANDDYGIFLDKLSLCDEPDSFYSNGQLKLHERTANVLKMMIEHLDIVKEQKYEKLYAMLRG